jgi:hypothetical protein
MKKHLLLARAAGAVILVAAAVLTALASPISLAQGPIAPGTTPSLPIRSDYGQIKAALDSQAPGLSNAAAQSTAHARHDGLKWAGLGASGYSPSDSTGAIGPDEYIELVNVSVGVYNRSGGLTSQNSQSSWTGIPYALGDATIEYSAHDGRYYSAMLYINGSNYRLIYGFSKTSSPSASNSDWCFYNSTFNGRYGQNLPDYPKLGDTADFMLIGVNTFRNGSSYMGSDVAWVAKPALGNINTCPSQSSLATGVQTSLRNADGSYASTPNPAKQTDSSSTGYVMANEDLGNGNSTVLSLFTVTKSSSGTPIFSPAQTVTVPGYAYPPSAPQQGTSYKLDTLDARLMSAWAAPDPDHSGAVAVWTGHTVAASSGGLGAEFRWYEINPTDGSLFQSGDVQNSSLYVFNGAVSPDRNGATGLFGSNALMAFNTSSSAALPAAAMATLIGGSQSGITTVATSPAADTDFTCAPTCRWGTTPAPAPIRLPLAPARCGRPS